MNTLHLSVIHDGASYQDRLNVTKEILSRFPGGVSFLGDPLGDRMRTFCVIKANEEKRKFGKTYTGAEIQAAADLVAEYMVQHVSEGA